MGVVADLDLGEALVEDEDVGIGVADGLGVGPVGRGMTVAPPGPCWALAAVPAAQAVVARAAAAPARNLRRSVIPAASSVALPRDSVWIWPIAVYLVFPWMSANTKVDTGRGFIFPTRPAGSRGSNRDTTEESRRHPGFGGIRRGVSNYSPLHDGGIIPWIFTFRERETP